MVLVLDCESDFKELGEAVRRGRLVVFPTDTVYGVGSSPLSEAGVSRCFQIKLRKIEKKVPVLFSSAIEASKFVNFNDLARLIIREFWPGKVSLILPVKRRGLPPDLVGEDNTLAVRVPNHACCQRLVADSGGSLIGTSANFSGQPPSTDPDDPSLSKFAENADYFVKGLCGTDKLPSTILDLSKKGQIAMVREGAVPRQAIADYLEKTSNAEYSLSTDKS